MRWAPYVFWPAVAFLIGFSLYQAVTNPAKMRCVEHRLVAQPTVAPSRVIQSFQCVKWEVMP